MAKPSGTRTPAAARLLTISPSEAFLPPTSSRSASPSSANHRTLSVSVAVLVLMRWSFLVGGHGRSVGDRLRWPARVWMITVDISSTDFAEELIDRAAGGASNIASARRSS